MSTRKVQKHCRIFQWVEDKDADLAAVIRDLCMEGALSGSRRSGATFLYPSEGVRKEIISDAYSAEPEKAVKLLNAHIIPTSVQSAAEFRKGVGSRLNIKLEVSSAKGDTVTLKNGATLALAKDFRPLGKDNIAVWTVTAGEIPLEGEEFRAPDRRGRREVKGGANTDIPGSSLSSRAQLATEVEFSYNNCQRQDRCRSEDPYLAHVVSLLNFLKVSHPDLLAALMPLVDRDPATSFYLLIEPYKASGQYLISDDVLFGPAGWNGAQIYEGAVSEFRDFFNQLPNQTALSGEDRSSGQEVVPWAYRDASVVRSATDEIRVNIIGEDGRKVNRVTLPKEVRERYLAFFNQNSIGGYQPILPDATIALLGDPLKKLWQDELRFILHQAMQTVRTEPMYSEDQFAEVVRMLRFTRPGNDYASEASLTDKSALSSNVAPQAEFALLMKFVNSSDFFYVPVSEQNIGGAWGGVPTAGGNAAFLNSTSLDVINTEVTKQKYLESRKDSPRALDAGSIAAVRHYMAIHGSLPPGLAM